MSVMGRALACPANVARTLGVRRGSLKLQLPVMVAHSHGKVNKQNAIISRLKGRKKYQEFLLTT